MDSLGTLGMTIAASAVAILTPFLKKGAEKFAEEIGKSVEESGGEAGKRVGEIVVDKTKKLFDKLKQKLSGNEEAEMNLRLLEKDPENGRSWSERRYFPFVIMPSVISCWLVNCGVVPVDVWRYIQESQRVLVTWRVISKF